jgi:hypothetical protein
MSGKKIKKQIISFTLKKEVVLAFFKLVLKLLNANAMQNFK